MCIRAYPRKFYFLIGVHGNVFFDWYSFCLPFGTRGRWETIASAAKNLMIGYGAHGTDLQRAPTWCDDPVLFSTDDAVRILPTGTYSMGQYALFCNEIENLKLPNLTNFGSDDMCSPKNIKPRSSDICVE